VTVQAHNEAASKARSVRPVDVAIALGVLAVSLALFATIASGTDADRGVDALTVSLIALSSLPLAARRLAPISVFAGTTLASTALHAVSEGAGPPIGPTLALYWLAASEEDTRPRDGVVLAIVAVALAVHAAGSAVAESGFPGTALLWGVLVWGGAWVAGQQTRLRRQRLAELEERARRSEREAERERRLAAAEERTRIARELHDSAGHAINVILVHAGLGRLRAEAGGGGGTEFETIEQVARETVAEIDQLVGALRDDPPDGAVEMPAGLDSLEALVARTRALGMRIGLHVRGERPALSAAVDRGAYRVLQEALTNAARHGDGSAEVDVRFARDAIEITVTNPLRDGHVPRASGGHGMAGMRERATLLGGRLEAGERDGRFELHARLPLDAEQR
jgi:signal transduction histidine kinase